MPGDIVGANIFNMATSQFVLHQGPVFTDLLLVDEINRMPPRTQAALLEAMEERQVTIDGRHAAAVAVVRHLRHPEPGRVRRHLSAARSGARSVPREDSRRLSRRAADEEAILQRYHEGFDARALDAVQLEPLPAGVAR